MEETGEDDPVRAVRAKARSLVRRYVETLGAIPPFKLEALASFCGLVSSQEMPRHSPDSEIAPVDGRVVLRVNRDRPIVRQRFSIGHEIGHTLFPDYQLAVRCRKPSERDWADPNDQLEALCDVAASEFLFPAPWFDDAVAAMTISAASVRDLAIRFEASSEATIRRLVEVCERPLAAVFCSWKLKPTEIRRRAADRHQQHMFGDAATSAVPKLRVDYSILNGGFRAACCDHVPRDKSVPVEGPVLEASLNQEPRDGAMWLDLGTTAREFEVHVVPIYTPDERIGPNGGVSVVLILQPRASASRRPN